MKYLTIFTPTYNRSNLLLHLYKSLCEQINKDFLWLIIDDGSKDNTKELVDIWKEENKIKIQYIYIKKIQENMWHIIKQWNYVILNYLYV
jgi:glycosyltransferase involved in cell wall biosynthesis